MAKPDRSCLPLLGQEAQVSPRRPSPTEDRVGSRITLFEACSAFTRVSACTLAESLTDPLTSECSCNKNPSCRSDCYRLERPSCRVGVPPTGKRRSSRRALRLRVKRGRVCVYQLFRRSPPILARGGLSG